MELNIKNISHEYSYVNLLISPFEQNCRLIWNNLSKKGVLIDPGTDLDLIYSAIEELDIIVEEIWITHGHIDHAGESIYASEKLSVPIKGPHIADKDLIDTMSQHVAKMSKTIDIYKYFSNVKSYTPVKWLEDGDSVSIDGLKFDVMWWPGHSPGHVVFYNEETNTLISGDVVFYQSVGRTDLYGSNQKMLFNVIKEHLLPMSDDTLILSGHGPDFYLGEVRNKNPFLVRLGKKM